MGLSTNKVFPYSFASLPSVRLCEWETLKENWQMRWREKIFSVSRQHLSSSRKELERHSIDRFSSRYMCTSLEIPAPAGSACWHSRSSTIGASFPSFQRAEYQPQGILEDWVPTTQPPALSFQKCEPQICLGPFYELLHLITPNLLFSQI